MRPCGVFDEKYTHDIAIVRTWQHWVIVIGSLMLLFAIPLIGSYHLIGFLNHLSITIIAVLGLQIVTGYCGQISFGQPAFMAVGAYTSVLLTTYGISFWAALPLSGIAAGIYGVLGGAPSMRIKGFYLAMATLAIHFVTMWLILHLDLTGKTDGLHTVPLRLGNLTLNTDKSMYYLIVTIMLVMTFSARNIARSKIGRAFVAIRDNDIAAAVMGINLYYYKLLAFFISCFYAGIAGCLYAHLFRVVHPEMFNFFDALWYIGMIIIGGSGSIPGVFFGVLFVRLLDELVLFSSPALANAFPWLGMSPSASIGIISFGIVLSLFLILEPRGLAHRWEIFKTSYRRYPFSY